MKTGDVAKQFLVLALLVAAVATCPALRAAPPGEAGAGVVTYEQVVELVRSGRSTREILERLKDTPTVFKLSTAQVTELHRAGATQELIDALQNDRRGPSPGSDVTDLAVILDCSGSMADRMPDGTTKMEAAKRAVTGLIRDLPNGRRLAFILYAHRRGNPKPLGCEDVEVVQPLSEVTDAMKDRLAARIARVQPVGWTPLALSLKVAGEALRDAKGICQVIVVTDGMETCGGDPIQEVVALDKQLNLADGVDIIGFIVTPDEKKAVQAIARKSHATYYDTNSARELDEAIRKARRRAREAAEHRRPGPPPATTHIQVRRVWRFDRGSFEDEGPGRGWVSHVKGQPTHSWDEVRRTPEFIELLRVQNGKEFRIRLFRDRATSRPPGRDKDFHKTWDGRWE